MPLDSHIPQTLLPDFCPIEAAVSARAAAGIKARGAVFTRREVMHFILDLRRFTGLSELTSLKTFITSFIGHIDAKAARES